MGHKKKKTQHPGRIGRWSDLPTSGFQVIAGVKIHAKASGPV